LSEAQNELVSAGTPQTAGWSLLDKVHIAVLVLDEKGLMYRLNRAARNVLRDEDVLRRGRGGVFAANAADSSVFSDALKKLGSEPEEQSTSQVIFLRDRGNGQRVPLTLERYYHDDKPTRFIVATLPISPSSSRVQALAKGLGLTASEAKVAALIQRGLSNRDAAALAGLKEQTFNTYAKRVLNKLDVKCRSEMARLLTWQASGGSM
jgi:DNA-binding CsgD family transcriptional regulator